jgi:hypothetical protein
LVPSGIVYSVKNPDMPSGNAAPPFRLSNAVSATMPHLRSPPKTLVPSDGSVHFISENIDYRNYQRLGDRRDSESVEPF